VGFPFVFRCLENLFALTIPTFYSRIGSRTGPFLSLRLTRYSVSFLTSNSGTDSCVFRNQKNKGAENLLLEAAVSRFGKEMFVSFFSFVEKEIGTGFNVRELSLTRD